jgi:hypothetical protein
VSPRSWRNAEGIHVELGAGGSRAEKWNLPFVDLARVLSPAACPFKERLNCIHHIRLMKMMGAISMVAIFLHFEDQNNYGGLPTWLR